MSADRPEQFVDTIRPDVLDEGLIVHLDADRRAARSEALHLMDRVRAVRGTFAGPDAEPVLEGAHDAARARQRARDVHADLDVALPDRALVIHGVERHDLA